MKNIFSNIVTCGLGASLLLGVMACSDDHYDVKPGNLSGANTVWQNIVASPELSSVANILRRTRVMKDENDINDTLTYAGMLNSSQEFTVFAPKDGTFDPQPWLDLLDQARAAKTDSAQGPEAAARIEYIVSNQFAQNHIARFNYEGTVAPQTIRMMNAKTCVYRSGSSVNGVAIEGASVNSRNGMLHTLSGISPFYYNIYDFMAADTQLDSAYNVLRSVEKRTFSEAGSVQGSMDENGQMVYVDSVYFTTNEILNDSRAQIKEEDSLYVAILPSNEAWNEGKELVKKLYNYADSYAYEWSPTNGSFSNASNSLRYRFNTDSLRTRSTQIAMLGSIFFNVTDFENVDRTDSAAIINYFLNADSVMSSNHVPYFNLKEQLQGLKPQRVSNGYVYVLPHYTTNPAYSLQKKLEIVPINSFAVANVSGGKKLSGGAVYYGDMINLDSETRDSSVTGDIENTFYTFFNSPDRTAMYINIRLNQVMSGRYRIVAEVLPNRINKNYVNVDKKGNPVEEKPKFTCQIWSDQMQKLAEKSGFEVNQDSIERVVLFDDFEFPNSYAELPSDCTSFPLLRLSMTNRELKQGSTYGLSIGKIFLEPIRE